ncbi:Histidine kinase-, DNA gyrase B-, and HSP90-like ATPase [Streptomyces reticuli]|nr:Histidine kinase-, DNA gyrase B-, and HSP90-like ATPase [Streptomyces reticuli]
MIEAQWRLPHGPRSAGRARALLRTQLTEWKIDAEVADTAELLLSELMSNAIRHARTPPGREIGVRLAQYDGRLRVEVADANCARPLPRKAEADDEQGRGLAIISALAVRWGCCPRRHGIGKATWAELLLPLPDQPRCVGANIRRSAGRTTTEGPGVDSALRRSSSRVSGVVRTPGTPKDSARAT